ncbi:MAG: nitronate monooxygenase [Acidimicrobiaceae bacterium]|nr:nitronate monooxygenase [Acidimicrobiaceae bacterium]MBO0747514.1 nitronate monooxygenase [Acidimicrobiaceae bacterium]
MTLTTAFTELVGVEVPIALAPMAGSAGGALAAAVSNGGALGLVGGGTGDPDWLDRELAKVVELTDKPWGVGFLSWAASVAAVEFALERRPAAVMLSFGDPRPLAEPVLEAGVRLIIQVTDLDEARQALDMGADVIVAQGAEAGGHGGRRATLPFIPVVVDLAGPVPVLAAGGIADGRGLAAALCLGAVGVLIGTRFQASSEALVDPLIAKAIIEGRGQDTERSRILDIARGTPWPERYSGRAIRNAFVERWLGKEQELEADEAAKAEFRAAVTTGDSSVVPVWAGEIIDLITDLSPAADLVAEIARQAELSLIQAGDAVTASRADR